MDVLASINEFDSELGWTSLKEEPVDKNKTRAAAFFLIQQRVRHIFASLWGLPQKSSYSDWMKREGRSVRQSKKGLKYSQPPICEMYLPRRWAVPGPVFVKGNFESAVKPHRSRSALFSSLVSYVGLLSVQVCYSFTLFLPQFDISDCTRPSSLIQAQVLQPFDSMTSFQAYKKWKKKKKLIVNFTSHVTNLRLGFIAYLSAFLLVKSVLLFAMATFLTQMTSPMMLLTEQNRSKPFGV